METNDKPFKFGSGGMMFIKTEHLKRGYCCKRGCRGCAIYYGLLPKVKKKDTEPPDTGAH
jgi:hypothetical protein